MELGIHFAHERFAPSQLLRMALEAEQAGFVHASCSDHFHPWTNEQGESGFAWSWLGAALQATTMSFGVVNAPGQRYHPAIVAQAAATLAEMYPGRFWLAIGSGESLNEHITGDRWPDKETRNRRLLESANIIRQLWSGEEVTHAGLVKINRAKLYSLPEAAPPLIGAAISEITSRWMGTWADGLITTSADEDALRKNVDAFERAGGEGKPVFCQTSIAYAATESEAVEYATKHWRVAALTPTDLADVETPREFDKKASHANEQALRKTLRITSNVDRILEWFAADARAGVDRVYINFIGADWEHFLGVCKTKLLPAHS